MQAAAIPSLSDPSTSAPRFEPLNTTVLGSGICIKGVIISREDLYLDGEVEGQIEAIESTVTVRPNATVIASIKAFNIVILGSVQGRIQALKTIELRDTCKLVGDVTTARIVMQDGAYFKGLIDICGPSDSTPVSTDMPAPEKRYSKLVDSKYVRDLSKVEESELQSLASELSSLDVGFYDAILQRLAESNRLHENIETPVHSS